MFRSCTHAILEPHAYVAYRFEKSVCVWWIPVSPRRTRDMLDLFVDALGRRRHWRSHSRGQGHDGSQFTCRSRILALNDSEAPIPRQPIIVDAHDRGYDGEANLDTATNGLCTSTTRKDLIKDASLSMLDFTVARRSPKLTMTPPFAF